ncbi:MAG: hypothetical protein IJ088_01340 [Clostridia bacterium]|nr:hypothetical protein [Clostridia bacterium]
MKKSFAFFFLILSCLLSTLCGAETRQGVIFLEGMEEPIEETLYESPQGFSFWYVSDRFSVQGSADHPEATVIRSLYSDDTLVLSLCTQEDAEKFIFTSGIRLSDLSGPTQVRMHLEPETGTFHFLTLIPNHGQYLAANGKYSSESAEGNAKYMDRILGSIIFAEPAERETLREPADP